MPRYCSDAIAIAQVAAMTDERASARTDVQVDLAMELLDMAERQLRHLGRARGKQIYRWLLEADLDLKGDSAMPPRLILKRLIVRLAAPKEMIVGQ